MTNEEAELIKKIDNKRQLREKLDNAIDFLFKCYEEFDIVKLQEICNATEEVIKKFFDEVLNTKELKKNISVDVLQHMFRPESYSTEDVRQRFDKRFLFDDKSKNTMYLTYLTDRGRVMKILLPLCSLLELKIVEEYIKELTKDMKVEISKYETRYRCECKTFTVVDVKTSAGRIDSRDVLLCCNNCGRSSKTWKLVSGKSYDLIKKVRKSFLGIKYWDEEKTNCGFEPSDHKQYDPKEKEYNLYFNDNIRKATFLQE